MAAVDSSITIIPDARNSFLFVCHQSIMKIISATTETPGMTKEQVDKFLEGKFMLQMSTLDEKGEPNI